MAEIGEMIRTENFRGEIDQINIEMLTVLLVTKWAKAKIIRITIERNRIILMIRGSFAGPSVVGGKR